MEPRWKGPNTNDLNWQFVGSLVHLDLWVRPHMLVHGWKVGMLITKHGTSFIIDNGKLPAGVLTRDEKDRVLAMLALS